MSTEDELKQVITAADDAINREDFDALMEFYAEDATLVVIPGRLVRGKKDLRAAFVRIAEHFQHKLEVKQAGMTVLEGADTALVLARTLVCADRTGQPTKWDERKATYVFRRYDGRWLCVVDNSYGTTLLDA